MLASHNSVPPGSSGGTAGERMRRERARSVSLPRGGVPLDATARRRSSTTERVEDSQGHQGVHLWARRSKPIHVVSAPSGESGGEEAARIENARQFASESYKEDGRWFEVLKIKALDPATIRFSQDSVNKTFNDGSNFRQDEAQHHKWEASSFSYPTDSRCTKIGQ